MTATNNIPLPLNGMDPVDADRIAARRANAVTYLDGAFEPGDADADTLISRIYSGWSIERAFKEPVHRPKMEA